MSQDVYTDDYGTAGAGSQKVNRNTAFHFNGKQVKFFKPKEPGTAILDILQRPDNTVGYTYKVHTGVGGSHDVLCPRQWGEPCPICDAQNALVDQKEAQGMDRKLAWKEKDVKALFPKEKIVYNIVDVRNPNEGIQLLDVSAVPSFHTNSVGGKSVQAKITNAANTHKSIHALQRFPYASPTEGSSLVVTLTEGEFPGRGGKMTKFIEWSNVSFIDRKQQYAPEVLNNVIMVENYLNKLTYEQIENLMYGAPVDDSVDEYATAQPAQATVVNSAPVQQPVQNVAPVQQPVQTVAPTPQVVGSSAPVLGVAPQVVSAPVEVKKDPCPHGLRFGVDTDTQPICSENCEIFSSCYRQMKENKKLAMVNEHPL